MAGDRGNRRGHRLPAWATEITAEWAPVVPGQRYPGDVGPAMAGASDDRDENGRPRVRRSGVYRSSVPQNGSPLPPAALTGSGRAAARPAIGRASARRPDDDWVEQDLPALLDDDGDWDDDDRDIQRYPGSPPSRSGNGADILRFPTQRDGDRNLGARRGGQPSRWRGTDSARPQAPDRWQEQDDYEYDDEPVQPLRPAGQSDDRPAAYGRGPRQERDARPGRDQQPAAWDQSPGRGGRRDSGRSDQPWRRGPRREVPDRQEPGRQEPGRQEPGRQKPSRQEPSRQEPSRFDRPGWPEQPDRRLEPDWSEQPDRRIGSDRRDDPLRRGEPDWRERPDRRVEPEWQERPDRRIERERRGQPAPPSRHERPAAWERPASPPPPSRERPAWDQPAREQPSREQPARERPAWEQPAAWEPGGEQPAAWDPARTRPAWEQPDRRQPAQDQPAWARPTPDQPEPARDRPAWEQQPAAEQPAREQPSWQQPVPEQPTPAQPAWKQPAREQPAWQQPVREQPAWEQQPVREQPAWEQQPVREQPAWEQQPARERPDRDRPAADQPVRQQPDQERPAARGPVPAVAQAGWFADPLGPKESMPSTSMPSTSVPSTSAPPTSVPSTSVPPTPVPTGKPAPSDPARLDLTPPREAAVSAGLEALEPGQRVTGTEAPVDASATPATTLPLPGTDGPAKQATAADPAVAEPSTGAGDDSEEAKSRLTGSPVATASPDTVLPGPDGPAAGAATALRAPTMLAPTVQPRQRPDGGTADDATPASGKDSEAQSAGTDGSADEGAADDTGTKATDPPQEEAPPRPPDPEQILAAYPWRFHHETLRELVDNPEELREVRDRLTEKLGSASENAVRARLLSLRAVVSRILGELGKAVTDGKMALAHAEATGHFRRIAIAQARLAHVLQWRGDFVEADRLFEEANSPELPDRLRATMHEHAGRSSYDQGRYMEACNHFERALELRKVEDPDLIARTELALDAVFAKVAANGWGPYPRSKEEILQVHQAPRPRFSERFQRWGYTTADGELAVAPSYADAQPFSDGVAWVRRPEAEKWELIDESGTLLIPASAGYFGVGSFSDGLAWVSRADNGAWMAIDKANKIIIPPGFDDVRPFRRGVAAVRRGGWGAVDKTGQTVVPTNYSAFVTALTDGRYVDGFTDEGLAIVDSNGRKGVVDRTGQVIVPPTYPAMVIHPVAFLIGTGNSQWGAIDRHGAPLIDPVLPSRADVMEEIDRLLADTKPVL